jgi:hypothetical protein
LVAPSRRSDPNSPEPASFNIRRRSDSLKQNIALGVKQFHGQSSGSTLDDDLVVKGVGKGIHGAKFCATRDVGKFVD